MSAPPVTGARRPPNPWLQPVGGLVVAAAVMAVGLLVAGSLGLVVAVDAVAVCALLIVLRTAPGTSRAPSASRPGGTGRGKHGTRWAAAILGRAWPGTTAAAADGYPSYTKIRADLGWGVVSRRHYDHVTRRLLIRLADAGLGERRWPGPGPGRDEIRRLVGDDVWPFLDPSQPSCMDSKAPGVDVATLTRIVERLERL